MLAIRTILHPTDLSEEAESAFHVASSLARDYGAELVLLTVYPPPVTGAEAVDRTRPEGDVEEDLFTQLRGLKVDPGMRVEYRVEEGWPANEIRAVAREVHADLIVMGTHGRSGIRRMMMGSVAEAVNRHATCPVVTVRSSVALEEEPVGSAVGRAGHEDPDHDIGAAD
jgi:nucleotide-binding universal stress UspA family protein